MIQKNKLLKPAVFWFCGVAISVVPLYAGWAQTNSSVCPPSVPEPTHSPIYSPVAHQGHSHHSWHHRRGQRQHRLAHQHVYQVDDVNGLQAQSLGPDMAGTQGVSEQLVYGHAIGTRIISGGRQTVLSDGVASDVQIEAGGTQTIAPGGTVSDTTVTGAGATQVVSANAQAVGGSFSRGGTQAVYGRAARAQVGLGGKQTVLPGGLATDAVVNGPGSAQIVLSGGVAMHTNLTAGATQTVYGTAIGTTLGGGRSYSDSTPQTTAPQATTPTPLTAAPAQNIASPTPLTAATAQNIAAPTPLTPVAAPQASTPAPFMMWSLFSGMKVGPQIQNWGTQAGWHVVWSAGSDPVLPKNHYYFGNFKLAVQNLVADLNKDGMPLQAKFDSTNHILVLNEVQQ